MSVQHSQPFNPTHERTDGEVFSPSLPGAVDWPDQVVHPPAVQRGTGRRTRRKVSRGWWWLLLVVLSGLAIVGTGMVFLDRSYAGRILPNVTVRGVAVGNMTREEARAAIEASFAPFLAQPVVLTYSGRSWTPTLAELVLHLKLTRHSMQRWR